MVNPVEPVKAEAARQPAAMGIVMELEHLAFPGRHLMYEAMARVLKDKDVALTPVVFSRFVLRGALNQGLEKMLAAISKKKLSVDKLATEIQEQYLRSVHKSSVRLDAAIESLLTDAAKAKAQIGAISFLPAAVAQEMVDRFGLKDVMALYVDEAKGYPAPEAWLKLAKIMSLSPARCVALTTSGVACQSALSAGLRCVVVPDVYTGHQDFGGADIMLESSKELRIKELVALTRPCAFRQS